MLTPYLMLYSRKAICFQIIIAFVFSSLYTLPAQAGELVIAPMPKPGTMVALSPAFTPAHLQGMSIHPDDALKFDFLVNKGEEQLDAVEQQGEYKKLVKYFLAALTVSNENQWVNLSPYEHNRVVQDDFGKTEMGRDLLAQDYLLKQITSSLMYPESGLGKSFWDKVFAEAQKQLGNTNIPVNTFNKVWIMPDEATVYESGNTVYIIHSHLKVMLEEDYVALNKNDSPAFLKRGLGGVNNDSHTVANKVIREIMLPILEKEVNEGKNFAQLRQVVSGMVLATWYKKALRESLLGKIYANKAKVQGVDLADPQANEAIYQQYLAAFKKGVYNYIKEDVDKYTNQTIPRKYFAGGFNGLKQADLAIITPGTEMKDGAMIGSWLKSHKTVRIILLGIALSPMLPGSILNSNPKIPNMANPSYIGHRLDEIRSVIKDQRRYSRAASPADYYSGIMLDHQAQIQVREFNGGAHRPQIVLNSNGNEISDIKVLYDPKYNIWYTVTGYRKGIVDVGFFDDYMVEQLLANNFISDIKSIGSSHEVRVNPRMFYGGYKEMLERILGNRYGPYMAMFRDAYNLGSFSVISTRVDFSKHYGTVDLVKRAEVIPVESPKKLMPTSLSNVLWDYGITIPQRRALEAVGILDTHATIKRLPYKNELNQLFGAEKTILNASNRSKRLVVEVLEELFTPRSPDFLMTPLAAKRRSATMLFHYNVAGAGAGANLSYSQNVLYVRAVETKKLGGEFMRLENPKEDKAMNPGGIDVSGRGMKFVDLKRDGKGVVLPIAQQDMAQLNQLTGFDPQILEIKALSIVPILSELRQKLEDSKKMLASTV